MAMEQKFDSIICGKHQIKEFNILLPSGGIYKYKKVKEICPRGNNNIVIIIFLVHDNVYILYYNCIKWKH
jgi:hypothetical protein